MPTYDDKHSPSLSFIRPDWPAPQSIFSCCTTRSGGVSDGAFESLNLATHVNDNAQKVAINRHRLFDSLTLPAEPQWLQQTHSTAVINLDAEISRDGDAATTSLVGRVAVVLTADCLPVLFCNRQGSEVAAAHAGWKGLLNGVLEETISAMKSPVEELIVWMGPAIGATQFEVGSEVREAFIRSDLKMDKCFKPTRPGHYLADLYALARLRLQKQGISFVYGGEFCTFSESDRFFSYRREKVTGRQASLIYIKK